jgi:hypothetical protein
MSEQYEEDDGGDIASGFGDSIVRGEVSDEKAQEMLYGGHREAAPTEPEADDDQD